MKIGTTGTSFITSLLIESFISTDNVVVACQSRSMEKARVLANKYCIEKAYDSYDEMLKDEDIDTIYIGLPNGLHYEYAKKALEANKNVLVEKPFASTCEETKELIELAKEKHLYLFETILTRHLPAVKMLKEKLAEISPIRMAVFNFSKYSSKYDKFLRNEYTNTFSKEMHGGALMDLNIYNLHLAHILFGKPLKTTYFANMQKDVDTSGTAILEYDGFIVNCIAAKDSDAKSFGQIMGEKGYITFEDASSIFGKFELTAHDGGKEVFDIDKEDRYVHESRDFKRIIDEDNYDEYLDMLNDTMEVMQILESLYENKAIE